VAQLALDAVTKTYRTAEGPAVTAVAGLSLAVAEGELLVVVGPSGSGKTTTLRLLAGLEAPSAGRILLGGHDVTSQPPGARDLAMIFQQGTLYPHLTVRENLALGLRLRGTPAAETGRRVAEAAELLGLCALLERLPRTLSGGERQRVALGRALVRQPQGFLFDEPFAHLDPLLRAQLRQELQRLRSRLPATVLVTHDQAEALALGDRIAVLHAGVLQQTGEPLQVYNEPANLFVAGFIGSPPMNLLPGRLTGAGSGRQFTSAPGWKLPLPAVAVPPDARDGTPVILGLRAEAVRLAGDQAADGRNGRVVALVEWVEPLGAETLVHLDATGVRLVARVVGAFRGVRGNRLTVEFDTGRVRLFDPATGRSLSGFEHHRRD
jgi:ABC-type sugar transport system ATPase subunit